MKHYLLILFIVLISFSCSNGNKTSVQKMQESIKEYIISEIADDDTYQAITFGKLDSLKVEDTEIYKKTQQEKIRLENSVSSLNVRMNSMEHAGVQKTDKLYIELKERREEDEEKLHKIANKMNDFLKRADEEVYSIEHKYKARKDNNIAIMTYDEFFYVDKNNNVIEDIVFYD